MIIHKDIKGNKYSFDGNLLVELSHNGKINIYRVKHLYNAVVLAEDVKTKKEKEIALISSEYL